MLSTLDRSVHFGFKRITRLKFTPAEDEQLRQLVAKHGVNAWPEISKAMATRNIRQCRDRWNHYLSVNPIVPPWTDEEDRLLHRTIDEIGPRWKSVQPFFQARSEADIRNRWFVLTRERTVPSLPLFASVPIPIGPGAEDSVVARADGSQWKIGDYEAEMDFFFEDW